MAIRHNRPMKFARLPIALLLASSLLAADCPTTGPKAVCPMYLGPGLVVRVIDAQSGALIGSGATIVVTGVTLHDSATLTRDDQAYTAMEDQAPAGRYAVSVRKVGYVDYANGNVVLTSDGCHVRPVTLNSTLQSR
jgi:hypothetical protein